MFQYMIVNINSFILVYMFILITGDKNMTNIKIKRGYEVLPDNNIRFGIRIANTSDVVISDVAGARVAYPY